jgi:predicted Zn finger-like uncharacterized protein
MILECPSCRARYLVQIGLFTQGGRQVRCARCKHLWHAVLPNHIDVFNVPEPEITVQASHGTAAAPGWSTSPASPMGGAPSNEGIHLPAVIRSWEVRKYLRQARQLLLGWWKWAYLPVILKTAVAGLLLLGLISWPIMDRQNIVRVLPQLSIVYEALGFDIDHNNMGLMLDQVKSELRYDSGTMKLYVDGVIHNATSEAQLIPDIKARALGPDKSVILSWQVEPPAATVAARSDVPFHLEAVAPMKSTIENVYLEFYSQDGKSRADDSGDITGNDGAHPSKP